MIGKQPAPFKLKKLLEILNREKLENYSLQALL